MGILLVLLAMVVMLAPPSVAADRRDRDRKPSGADSAILWNNRAADLYSAGKYEQAIRAYDQAIKINPRYTDAYSNRGAAYDALNQPDRAVLDYTKAIQLNPRFTASYVNRALAYCDLAKFQEAIVDWNIVLKRTPRDANAYYKRGFCHQSLGNLQGALTDYEKALKCNPRMHKAVTARDLMRKALALAPASGEKPEVRKPEATKPEIEKPVVSKPEIEKTEPAAALTEQPKPHITEHPARTEDSIAPANNSSTGAGSTSVSPASYCISVLHHVAGNVCLTVGQYEAAAANFTTAANANPNDAFAYFRRANAFAMSGQSSRAIEDYDNALRVNPRFNQAQAKRDALISKLRSPR